MTFQYPSSGSTDCNNRCRVVVPAEPKPLSVSLKRIDGLQPQNTHTLPRGGKRLSVSLKRIDGLQLAPRERHWVAVPLAFQYPSSGSTDCNRGGDAHVGFALLNLSVSLKRIDGLQRSVASAV